jgi:hypothetical protein
VDGRCESESDRCGRDPAYSVNPQVVRRHHDDADDERGVEEGQGAHGRRAYEAEHGSGGDKGERDMAARHRRVRTLHGVGQLLGPRTERVDEAELRQHSWRRNRDGEIAGDRHELRDQQRVARSCERVRALQPRPHEHADSRRQVDPDVEQRRRGHQSGPGGDPGVQRGLDEQPERALGIDQRPGALERRLRWSERGDQRAERQSAEHKGGVTLHPRRLPGGVLRTPGLGACG